MNKTKIKLKYLVPNLFTSLSLISGIFAVKFSLQSDFITACWLIAFSMFCDGLDGKLARLLDAASRIGSIFDTISDFITFGIVPAVIAYIAVLHKFKVWGILIALLYITCGALRLTRFMMKTVTVKEKKPFIGLPIPAAAGMIASFTIFNFSIWGKFKYPVSLPILMLFISFLMISRIQYLPVEKKDFKITFGTKLFFLAVIASMVLFVKYHFIIFILWSAAYIVFGLLRHFYYTLK